LIEKFGGLNSRYPRLELNDLKRICHLWYRNAERSEEFGKLAKKGELGKDYREF